MPAFRNTLVFFLLTFFSFSATAQISIFVSPKGSDKNAGSLQSPFATIERALAFAHQFPQKNTTINLREGVYYLSKTIVLDHTTVAAKTLKIAGYKNEKVFISAGRRLQLQWKPYKNGIFQASVPENISFERLYVNGKLLVLARYPNYDSAARVFHGAAADAIAPERIAKWKNPIGGYVHALHDGEWGGFHYRIVGIDDHKNLQLEGGWQNNRPAPMHREFRFVENIFEELDTLNEWWLDQKNHILYFYPPTGFDFSKALIEVSNLKNSIELRGTAENPLTNVELKNLHFIHNERTFMDTKEPLLRSDWTIYRGGVVLLQGTENCKVTDCSFVGVGGNAIMLSDYNKQDTISGCLVEHIGANAVCFIGDPKAVRSPLFNYNQSLSYEQLDKTAGPINNNFPQQCVVADNLFHDLGEIEKQATGVEIEMSSSITVMHNSIYNTPRAGINIGDGCWGGHVLAFNDVFNTVLETGDHGAFNSWGRDRYWNPDRHYMDSLVAIHPELILLDAQKQNLIHDNRFRCDHGWDIDLDDGSSNYRIYNNVCLNGGLKLREGFFRIVENNILINNSFHPHVWFNHSHDVFEHNIVSKKYFPIEIKNWGDNIDDNLFPDSTALHDAQENGTDKNSIVGDPMFVDASTGNYTVKSNSPAIKIGFQNFNTENFGVQNAELKKLAMKPAIPVLLEEINSFDKSAIISFLGGKIKSVDGLGERSAYGLPSEAGVIIVSAGNNSLLSKSDLMDKDVIITAEGKEIKDVKTLMEVYQSSNWKGKLPIEVFRNQQLIKLTLLFK